MKITNKVSSVLSLVLISGSVTLANADKYKTPEPVAKINGLIALINGRFEVMDEYCQNSPDCEKCTEQKKSLRKRKIIKKYENSLKEGKETAKEYAEENSYAYEEKKALYALFHEQVKQYEETGQLSPIEEVSYTETMSQRGKAKQRKKISRYS